MDAIDDLCKQRDVAAGEGLLKDVLRRGGGSGLSTALLLIDTLLAIAFAGGVAGAVASLAAGDDWLAAWVALIALAAAARGLASMGALRLGARAAARAKDDLRRGLVGQVLRGRTSTHQGVTGGGLMNAVVDEVESLDGYIARFMPARRAAAIAPLVVLTAAAWASPGVALILVGTLAPFIVLMALAGAASGAESRRQFDALARLSSLFADRLRALPVVLAFRAESRETARLAQASNDVAARTLRVLRLAFVSSAVLEFFAALCVALVAVYAGFNLLGLLPFRVPEKLDLARGFFVLALAPEFYAPMRRLAAAYHDRQAALIAAEGLAAVGTGDAEIRSVDATPIFVAPPRIRFEAVDIGYANSDPPVVRNLSFDVPAGRTLALVGPSGSGKTTILRTLLGDVSPISGRIRIGNAEWAPGTSLARHASWVGQSPLIVPGTLRDNLRLAAPDAADDELIAVVALVGLGDMLAARSAGLDTVLDARGGGLSGGERRRIAFARALLKPSSIWLLDEPTAHLDAVAEAAMIDTLARLRTGRTTLIATHSARLAGIADVVVRLGDAA